MVSELTESEITEFKQRLKRRFREVREEIRQELIHSDKQHFIDLAGEVRDLENQSLADLLVDLDLADIDRHIQEIREIDASLIRIAEGGYGECIQCGGPIDKERLTALPTAQRCHRCQDFHEKSYIQQGRASL